MIMMIRIAILSALDRFFNALLLASDEANLTAQTTDLGARVVLLDWSTDHQIITTLVQLHLRLGKVVKAPKTFLMKYDISFFVELFFSLRTAVVFLCLLLSDSDF